MQLGEEESELFQAKPLQHVKNMNVLFLTQSLSLDMFYNLMQIMKESMDLDKVGFHVSDSRFFKQFRKDHPGIESFHILKEWEIVRDSRSRDHEVSSLRRYEKELGRPFLWNALVADRWIYFGKRCTYDQDYRPRYNHERMLAILQVGLERIEEFFRQLQPDLVVSFQCITLGEYISYLLARARGITFLNLRPTRIENFVYAGESILEPSRILEGLDNEIVQEKFREAMLSPAIFSGDGVDQVLKGFEHKILQIKMEASKVKAKKQLDLEALNQVLKFKKARETRFL